MVYQILIPPNWRRLEKRDNLLNSTSLESKLAVIKNITKKEEPEDKDES